MAFLSSSLLSIRASSSLLKHNSVLRMMKVNVSQLPVVHVPVQQGEGSFEIEVSKANKETAYLQYYESSDVMEMYHTFVPPALEGQGIAGKLAKAAFDYAVENNKKMKLTCSYLVRYYEKNKTPEYEKLVVQN